MGFHFPQFNVCLLVSFCVLHVHDELQQAELKKEQETATQQILLLSLKLLGLMVIFQSHGILLSSHPHGAGLSEGKCLCQRRSS